MKLRLRAFEHFDGDGWAAALPNGDVATIIDYKAHPKMTRVFHWSGQTLATEEFYAPAAGHRARAWKRFCGIVNYARKVVEPNRSGSAAIK